MTVEKTLPLRLVLACLFRKSEGEKEANNVCASVENPKLQGFADPGI